MDGVVQCKRMNSYEIDYEYYIYPYMSQYLIYITENDIQTKIYQLVIRHKHVPIVEEDIKSEEKYYDYKEEIREIIKEIIEEWNMQN